MVRINTERESNDMRYNLILIFLLNSLFFSNYAFASENEIYKKIDLFGEGNISKFAGLIAKNSNTQVILVKNELQLIKFFKKNLISDEIIIGMGAGAISKWIAGLKYSL